MDFSDDPVIGVSPYHDFGGFSTEEGSSFERPLEEPDWDQFDDFDWPIDDNFESKTYQETTHEEGIVSASTSTLESYEWELYQNSNLFPAEFDIEPSFIDAGNAIDFSSVAGFDPFQVMAPSGADSHLTSIFPLDTIQTSGEARQSNYNSPYSSFSSTPSNMVSNTRSTPATSPSSAEASPSMSPRSYACKKCPKTFLKQHELNRHETLHTRPIKCPEPTCSHRTPLRRDMRRHVLAKHPNHPSLDPTSLVKPKCTVPGCKQEFTRKDNLRRHMMRAHRGVRV